MTRHRSLRVSAQLLTLALGALLLAAPALAERTSSYSYTPAGLLASIDGPRTDVADITSYEYDSAGNRIRITNALGQVTEIPEHDAHGNALRIIDPNGLETHLAYDARQRLISRTLHSPDGAHATTSYDYDPVGQLTQVTLPDGSTSSYEYDAARRLVAMADSLGNRIQYSLDAAGNRTETNIEDPAGALTATQQQVFNALSELIQSITAGGDTTSFTYDAGGKLIARIDALGNSTVHSYDIHERLLETLDALGGATSYAYDSADNLSALTDANTNATAYSHNAFGEVVGEDSPDRGATASVYDAAGNLIEKTDARGITVAYSYDALNRPLLADYPGTDEDIAYAYDSCANGIGRLCRITDGTGETQYSYDGFGNRASETRQQDGYNFTTAYSYDLAGRTSTITYPSGRQVAYTRDAAGQVIAVDTHFEGQTQSIASAIAYMPFGPLRSITYGNALLEESSYDLDYRLSGRTLGALYDLTYSHDAVGNISAISDALDLSRQYQFSYDALDRLIDEDNPIDARAYQYDPLGNRTRFTRVRTAADGSTQTWSPSLRYAVESNHLLKIGNAAKQSFDAAGNTLTARNGTHLYGYNAAGRLARAEVRGVLRGLYSYDGHGRRIKKVRYNNAGQALTYYFQYGPNGQLLSEAYVHPAGYLARYTDFLWLQERPLAQIKADIRANGTVRRQSTLYLHPDHLNTPRLATDETQTVRWRWDSDAFGRIGLDRDPDGDGAKTLMWLRFPGQYFDGETGLYYNYFRDYDPNTGRYIESDPIGLEGGTNTYLYVNANPLITVDPFGLVEWTGTGSGWTFLTAGKFTFSLETDCVNGEKGWVRVVFTGAGLSLGLRVSATYSEVKLNDPYDFVNPDSFNGGAWIAFSGQAFGTKGDGCSAMSLGIAGGFGCNKQKGLDLSVGVLSGSSTVVDQRVDKCCN